MESFSLFLRMTLTSFTLMFGLPSTRGEDRILQLRVIWWSYPLVTPSFWMRVLRFSRSYCSRVSQRSPYKYLGRWGGGSRGEGLQELSPFNKWYVPTLLVLLVGWSALLLFTVFPRWYRCHPVMVENFWFLEWLGTNCLKKKRTGHRGC